MRIIEATKYRYPARRAPARQRAPEQLRSPRKPDAGDPRLAKWLAAHERAVTDYEDVFRALAR